MKARVLSARVRVNRRGDSEDEAGEGEGDSEDDTGEGEGGDQE